MSNKDERIKSDHDIIKGKRIKETREKNNLTQLEFANEIEKILEINYDQKTISNWERAEYLPSGKVLKVISERFNVPLAYLENDDGKLSEIISRGNWLINQNELYHTMLKNSEKIEDDYFVYSFDATETEAMINKDISKLAMCIADKAREIVHLKKVIELRRIFDFTQYDDFRSNIRLDGTPLSNSELQLLTMVIYGIRANREEK